MLILVRCIIKFALNSESKDTSKANNNFNTRHLRWYADTKAYFTLISSTRTVTTNTFTCNT